MSRPISFAVGGCFSHGLLAVTEKEKWETKSFSFLPNRKPTLLKVNQQPAGPPHFLLAKQLVFASTWYRVAAHLLRLFSH